MRHALIIGSQTLGLSGVHNDIAHISSRLERRGFTLDVHVGDMAWDIDRGNIANMGTSGSTDAEQGAP